MIRLPLKSAPFVFKKNTCMLCQVNKQQWLSVNLLWRAKSDKTSKNALIDDYEVVHSAASYG